MKCLKNVHAPIFVSTLKRKLFLILDITFFTVMTVFIVLNIYKKQYDCIQKVFKWIKKKIQIHYQELFLPSNWFLMLCANYSNLYSMDDWQLCLFLPHCSIVLIFYSNTTRYNDILFKQLYLKMHRECQIIWTIW